MHTHTHAHAPKKENYMLNNRKMVFPFNLGTSVELPYSWILTNHIPIELSLRNRFPAIRSKKTTKRKETKKMNAINFIEK